MSSGNHRCFPMASSSPRAYSFCVIAPVELEEIALVLSSTHSTGRTVNSLSGRAVLIIESCHQMYQHSH
jgi:hypothetical protein